jgi:hypothetical protein
MLAGPPRQIYAAIRCRLSSWGTTDGVNAAPSDPNAPAQYHGKFASTRTSTTAEFIALMRVNVACNDTPPVATKKNGVWTLRVDDRSTVTFKSGSKHSVARVRIHGARPP